MAFCIFRTKPLDLTFAMDIVSKNVRSHIMAQIRSFDNKTTEKAFIQMLRRNSIKGWRRTSQLFGKPDFVFPSLHVAVFIDGCFWHNCPKHYRRPSSNVSYWQEKIARNQRRDKEVNRMLRKKGWRVIRVWEHEIKSDRYLARKLGLLIKLSNDNRTR